MATPLVHLQAGREGTYCGRGASRPAFVVTAIDRVTCARCLAANARANARPCPAPLAYRDRSDIGPARTCGAPAVTDAGFCRRHDPATQPRRDRAGRMIATAVAEAIDSVAANVHPEAPAADWVANIRYQLDTHGLDEADARTIARAFGMSWPTLLAQAAPCAECRTTDAVHNAGCSRRARGGPVTI